MPAALLFFFFPPFFSGVLSSLRGVAIKEGFLGLYKGNWAQMIRIFPYAAVQFLSYEQYKKVSNYPCSMSILGTHQYKFL